MHVVRITFHKERITQKTTKRCVSVGKKCEKVRNALSDKLEFVWIFLEYSFVIFLLHCNNASESHTHYYYQN